MVGSTNTEALQKASEGDPGQLWVTASEQITGKARRGREWVSKPGNLYASLLLIEPAEAEALASLPLAISLALHKAVVSACPETQQDLKIKWPNDLLLGGKKLSGILLEAARDTHGRLAVVVGCGINCQHFPDNPLYPATSIKEFGIALEPQDLFAHLAREMAEALRIWAGGAGFSIIRREWLDRAVGIGQPIIARMPDAEIHGRFVDIDAEGFLLLQDEHNAILNISAADIFFGDSTRLGA